MTKPTAFNAPAIKPRETYAFAAETTWKNGQVTRDNYRYLGTELISAEVFTAEQLQRLMAGKIVTATEKFAGTTTRWVSLDALAAAAFKKGR